MLIHSSFRQREGPTRTRDETRATTRTTLRYRGSGCHWSGCNVWVCCGIFSYKSGDAPLHLGISLLKAKSSSACRIGTKEPILGVSFDWSMRTWSLLSRRMSVAVCLPQTFWGGEIILALIFPSFGRYKGVEDGLRRAQKQRWLGALVESEAHPHICWARRE